MKIFGEQRIEQENLFLVNLRDFNRCLVFPKTEKAYQNEKVFFILVVF